MRASDDEFLDKCAIEAMKGVSWFKPLSDEKCFDEAAKRCFEVSQAMVKERKRLMDEQKKTKVSEKFGKLPEVE